MGSKQGFKVWGRHGVGDDQNPLIRLLPVVPEILPDANDQLDSEFRDQRRVVANRGASPEILRISEKHLEKPKCFVRKGVPRRG